MTGNKVVLHPKQVEFFQHFIKQYNGHFEKGELREAYHCCVAILLELQNIIPEVKDEK